MGVRAHASEKKRMMNIYIVYTHVNETEAAINNNRGL